MPDLARRRRLIETLSRLSSVVSVEQLVTTLRGSARSIAQADGITIVRRDGETVTYIAEDAACPLWTGHNFPIERCISGIAMIENQPVLIPDITKDERVPLTAYEPTFVRSMAMFPIGVGKPQMAMGAYWAHTGPIDPEAVALLSSLARAASMSFERLDQAAARRAASA